MFRSLLLLPLVVFVPFVPVASGGPESPPPGVATADNKAGPAPARQDTPPAGFHQVKLNGHTFTLPEGFTIELAAGPPLADRPIVAALDEKGRLYVCDSSGSNEPVAVQVKKKPHRIVRLEDTDGDGKYDQSTVFVPNVMFPEGAMWLNGSLYVAAPPQILKFTDTDGDGKADKEEVWFDGKTLTGCANDLHGPYAGPDGYIYWCKGAFAKQEYKLPNGKMFTTRASHIFRAKPDGSNIEPVMTGGMDNPVDVVFTPGGERIFSTTFFQHPGNGRRDGLIHAIYGGVYGKDHDPVYEHPWTSPQLMPVMTHLGPAAPCGLHRYESDQFGKEYENNIFCCQFNMRKVSRHVLVPSGSTYTTKDSDFVVSDSLDFHPTDVIEDADGSLLILDTGGWYKLCCPTSQLVKPDVTGAVYRVKKVGAHKVNDPRGLGIDWNPNTFQNFGLLGDPRPVVQQRAIEFCASRGQVVARHLAKLVFTVDRHRRFGRNVIRALARIDAPEAREAVREAMTPDTRDDALTAIHAASLWRDAAAGPQLVKLLAHENPHVRRAAAEALGRIGDSKAIPAIIGALADESNDRVLDHSLTYALIEIADPKTTAEGLKNPSPRVRRAVLVALDQMPGGTLDAATVLAELGAKDAALRETAWWIAGRHPQWGDQLAGYFRDRLKLIEKMTPPEQDELTNRFVPFLKTDAVRKAVGDALAGTLDTSASRSILRGLARSGLKTFPEEWTGGVLLALFSGDDDTARDAIAVLRAVPPTGPGAADIIAKVSAHRKRVGKPWPTELDYALRAVAPAGAQLAVPDAGGVIADTHSDRTGPVRAAAADLLTRAALTPESLVALAAAIRTANPVEVGKLLPAFARSADEKVGLALVAALSDPKLRAVVRAEQVKPILDKYPKPVRDEAEKLYALLAEARKDEHAKLERLVKELPAGDVRRGQVVFNGAKAQCVSCHKIGYVGGLVGPDLTRIGGIRAERDLLESIVFPSASFVRSYEPVRVTTADGRVLQGIVKKDAPDEIVLVVGADKEERVARADVESITPGTVSVMPAGLDTQLTPQDLADLVAFLKACK
ncbi:MAG: Cytochrome c [Gemmataceae bacterium]|nr:Cytochrome c [Gemmataceae bacterium]